MKMMNVGYFMGILGGIWLLAHSLWRGRMFRGWRYRTEGILGAALIVCACVGLFGPEKLHASREARVFYSAEGFLIGLCAGIFLSLSVAGWPKGEKGTDAFSDK